MSDMNVTQLVDEIGVYVENCRSAGMLGGGSMIKVNRDELLAMLDELREQLPDELSESKRILRTRDDIIARANEKAERIIADAAQEAGVMIDDNEIVTLANMRAEEIISSASAQAEELLSSARAEAYEVRKGALEYTQEAVGGLEDIFGKLLSDQREYFRSFESQLSAAHKEIVANKREIDLQLGMGTRPRTMEEFESGE